LPSPPRTPACAGRCSVGVRTSGCRPEHRR
jgi:hypothetical protein